jgi:hypothetical protein
VLTSKLVGCLIAALALSACAQNDHHQTTTFLDLYAKSDPAPSHFTECHGFGCAEVSKVSLNPGQWQRVAAMFRPSAKDARSERRQVSHAVSLMQRLVGAQTGTAVHQWTHDNMSILPNRGDPTQLDCIDGAVNTWTYMTMMEKSGFLRFHRVANLSNAGSLINARNTAVLEQKDGGFYAVDPSLVDFGVPPPVIPLATWMGDWPPNLAANNDAASPPVKPKRKTLALAATPLPAAAGANP